MFKNQFKQHIDYKYTTFIWRFHNFLVFVSHILKLQSVNYIDVLNFIKSLFIVNEINQTHLFIEKLIYIFAC